MVSAGAAAVVLLSISVSQPAAAAEPSTEARAAAAALFDEGRKLVAAGKYAEACPKLEESYRLDPGSGTRYHVADCHESIGRTASAWLGFRDVAAEAVKSGRKDREKLARDRAAALEPKLSRLRIVVQAKKPPSGLEIFRNGSLVGSATWGSAIPVDPGEQRVKVAAPGKVSWEKTVRVDGPGAVVEVVVPELADGPAAPPNNSAAAAPAASASPAPLPAASASPAPPPPPAASDNPSPRAWQMPLGITALALGAAGLGAGIGVGFLAKSTHDGADCDDRNVCSSSGLTERQKALTQGNVATGVFVAGAVLAAGGLVLWITAPSRDSAKQPAPSASLRLTPGGLIAAGRW